MHLTVGKCIDSYRKIPIAQKLGRQRIDGEKRIRRRISPSDLAEGSKSMWSFSRTARFLALARRIVDPRCSAHLLWIRLCASDLTVGKTVDFKGKFRDAQKEGIWGYWGEFCFLEDCAMQTSTAPMFCTPFVDKIVRKDFDCTKEP